jgi:indole-3-glycerol phosphate synthase
MTDGLLLRLVDEARAETDARRRQVPLPELSRKVRRSDRDFAQALRGKRLAVIAEMKARTPSMGLLAKDGYSPKALAVAYTEGGAAALSVLCQQASFGGRPEDLSLARSGSGLPIMRKDFVVDEYQVVEARYHDADAILLIMAALTPDRLRELLGQARALGMEALVEVHSEAEADAALSAGARVIGVNHRDLDTFQVDLSLTQRLRPLIPVNCALVSESGIRGADEARRMRESGADAILVGEALMRAADPAALLRELAGT